MILLDFYRHKLESQIIKEKEFNNFIFTTIADEFMATPLIQENWAKIKRRLDDIEIRVFTNNEQREFIKIRAPFLLFFYDSIDVNYGAAKSDFFRYLYSYLEGGLYLDFKSSITKNIFEYPDLNDFDIYLSTWEGTIYENWGKHPEYDINAEYVIWFILSKRGNTLMLDVIMELLKNIVCYHSLFMGVGRIAVLRTTGPINFTVAIKDRLKYHSCSIIRYGEFGLICNIFDNENRRSMEHIQLQKNHYIFQKNRLISISKCNLLYRILKDNLCLE